MKTSTLENTGMSKLMRVLTGSLVLALSMAIGADAMAQPYPSKPVRLIVPFGASGMRIELEAAALE